MQGNILAFPGHRNNVARFMHNGSSSMWYTPQI